MVLKNKPAEPPPSDLEREKDNLWHALEIKNRRAAERLKNAGFMVAPDRLSGKHVVFFNMRYEPFRPWVEKSEISAEGQGFPDGTLYTFFDKKSEKVVEIADLAIKTYRPVQISAPIAQKPLPGPEKTPEKTKDGNSDPKETSIKTESGGTIGAFIFDKPRTYDRTPGSRSLLELGEDGRVRRRPEEEIKREKTGVTPGEMEQDALPVLPRRPSYVQQLLRGVYPPSPHDGVWNWEEGTTRSTVCFVFSCPARNADQVDRSKSKTVTPQTAPPKAEKSSETTVSLPNCSERAFKLLEETGLEPQRSLNNTVSFEVNLRKLSYVQDKGPDGQNIRLYLLTRPDTAEVVAHFCQLATDKPGNPSSWFLFPGAPEGRPAQPTPAAKIPSRQPVPA